MTCLLLSVDTDDIYLSLSVNGSSIYTAHASKRFGLKSLFASTSTMAALTHLYLMFRPDRATSALARGRPRPLRIMYLYIVLPALHACVLVGVARVVDAWCIIAAVLLLIEIVTQVWVHDILQHQARAMRTSAAVTLLLSTGLYIVFWILVWVASAETKLASLGLFCAATMVSLGTYAWVSYCSTGARWSPGVLREIVFNTTLVCLQVLCITLWTVNHTHLAHRSTTAVATISTVACIGYVAYVVLTAPEMVGPTFLLDDGPESSENEDDDDEAESDAEANDPNKVATSLFVLE